MCVRVGDTMERERCNAVRIKTELLSGVVVSYLKSRVSSVSIMARLQKVFLFPESSDRIWGPPSPIHCGYLRALPSGM